MDGRVRPEAEAQGLVFRLDVYVGERDSHGLGFSDNVIFRKQYYVQVFPGETRAEVFLHTGEQYLGRCDAQDVEGLREIARADEHLGGKAPVQHLTETGSRPGWFLDVEGTGFAGRLRVAIVAEGP
ncbi:hypothetical protein [Ornithinimicrobium sufpigmenti]|uniref:hypothetical protein n=1 Tax=Ornithinimicrobium sufpigmenti TaxID=2508882 RepID=UPI001EE093CB|nr:MULTISPECIES: hypothetical protein [unclassified Ornithinimicrobium]